MANRSNSGLFFRDMDPEAVELLGDMDLAAQSARRLDLDDIGKRVVPACSLPRSHHLPRRVCSESRMEVVDLAPLDPRGGNGSPRDRRGGSGWTQRRFTST